MLFVPANLPELATDSEGIPIYMQGWFTRVIADKVNALSVTVVENTKVVGSITVSVYRNPLGLKQAYNLPWARISGPLIDENVDPMRRPQIVRELVDLLPNNLTYFITLSNEHDFRTFLAAGFTADLGDNFIVPVEQATTWERGLSKMTRRHLRKARKELSVSTLNPAEFIRLYAKHLSMRRRKPYAELSIARAHSC